MTPEGLRGRLAEILQRVPKKEHLVTKERMKQGNMDVVFDSRNYVVDAREVDTSIAAHLVAKRQLQAFHAIYGLGLMELKHAFLSPYRYKSNSIYLAEIFGSMPSTNYAAEMYERVYKGIGRERELVVLYACDTPVAMLHDIPHGLVFAIAAFEKLVETMDGTRRAMEEEQRIKIT